MSYEDWSGAEIAEHLAWYAHEHEMAVFTGVPVTGPNLGWGAKCPELLENVAVPTEEAGAVQEFEEDAFRTALSQPLPVHPLLAQGWLGRSGYGYLATRQAFLARSWRPEGPVQPIALASARKSRPNVAPAYFAAGFRIVALPGEQPREPRGGGGGNTNRDPWEAPKPGEDEILRAMWTERGHDGWWLAEVPVGEGAARQARRIDAVVVPSAEARHSKQGEHLEDFRDSVAAGTDIELVEAKRKLDFTVVGQLLCGAQMITEWCAEHGQLSLTAAVWDATDEPLRWFCARHGIRVEVVQRAEKP